MKAIFALLFSTVSALQLKNKQSCSTVSSTGADGWTETTETCTYANGSTSSSTNWTMGGGGGSAGGAAATPAAAWAATDYWG